MRPLLQKSPVKRRQQHVIFAVHEVLETRRLLTGYSLSTFPFDATDGANSASGVVADANGDLFGTTANGGLDGHGTVFEIAHGTRTITTLASFDVTDGASCQTPVTLDSSGDIFGTTLSGGANGSGSVFEVVAGSGTITTLGSFDGANGAGPEGGVVLDSNGDLFGTANGGGQGDDGVVFEVPKGGSITDIANFNGSTGGQPVGNLLLESGGALFGTASTGGMIGNVDTDQGTVFDTATGGGGIGQIAAFNFDGSTGSTPEGGVIMDSSGDLFGVTERTSQVGTTDGTVFEIANGSSAITTVATFNGANGEHPEAGLILDSSGDMFGTTNGDALQDGVYGTVFEIVKGSGTVTTLHTFDDTDGEEPNSSLYMDASGNLYGTVLGGGPNNDEPGGDGEVFELSPVGTPTQLAFAATPSGAAAGTAITPAVTVDVEDANGNIVTTDDSNVTLTLGGGTAGATMGGTAIAAAVDGVATFSNVSISAAGTGYTLTATDGSLTSATTSPFAVSSGGGGGGSSGLTPAIVSSTVPEAVVGGVKLHGALKLKLTNPSSATEKGFTIKIYASTSPTLDTTTDTLVTSITKPSSIKTEKSAAVSVPITLLSATLAGSYYLIAETIDSAGNTESVATTSTVTVAAPFVSLSESVTTTLPTALVSGTSAKGTVTLTITNSGNVPSKGLTPIDVTASTVPGVLGTTITTLTRNLNILPGKSVKVAVPIKSTPALADGSYYIVAQVTNPFASGTSLASTSGTITVAAPFITLAAVLGPVSNVKSGDTLTLTNNGNIEDNPTFTATIGFSTDPQGLQPIGGSESASKTLHIPPGKSLKMHSTGWTKIDSGLTAGVPYYLTVRVTDATGNSAFAVSSTSFTI